MLAAAPELEAKVQTIGLSAAKTGFNPVPLNTVMNSVTIKDIVMYVTIFFIFLTSFHVIVVKKSPLCY